MPRPKKETTELESNKFTHNIHTIDGNKIEVDGAEFDCDKVQIIVPKGMPYAKIRRALEFAALRIR